jgi:hypothetical protein
MPARRLCFLDSPLLEAALAYAARTAMPARRLCFLDDVSMTRLRQIEATAMPARRLCFLDVVGLSALHDDQKRQCLRGGFVSSTGDADLGTRERAEETAMPARRLCFLDCGVAAGGARGSGRTAMPARRLCFLDIGLDPYSAFCGDDGNACEEALFPRLADDDRLGELADETAMPARRRYPLPRHHRPTPEHERDPARVPLDVDHPDLVALPAPGLPALRVLAARQGDPVGHPVAEADGVEGGLAAPAGGGREQRPPPGHAAPRRCRGRGPR